MQVRDRARSAAADSAITKHMPAAQLCGTWSWPRQFQTSHLRQLFAFYAHNTRILDFGFYRSVLESLCPDLTQLRSRRRLTLILIIKEVSVEDGWSAQDRHAQLQRWRRYLISTLHSMINLKLSRNLNLSSTFSLEFWLLRSECIRVWQWVWA